jgi:hypothetical protein
MEDGADAKGSANGHDSFHRRMQRRCVKEGEAMAAQYGCAFGG